MFAIVVLLLTVL